MVPVLVLVDIAPPLDPVPGLMPLVDSVVLPGDMPGVVTVGAFGAPEALTAEEPLLVIAAGGTAIESGVALLPMLPGDWPGAVVGAAFGAPVGAGDV